MKHFVVMDEDMSLKCSFLKYICYKVLSFTDICILLPLDLLHDTYQIYPEKQSLRLKSQLGKLIWKSVTNPVACFAMHNASPKKACLFWNMKVYVSYNNETVFD